MNIKPVPYQRTVFVCANTREEGKIACANQDRDDDRGDLLCAQLKEHVKKAGLKDKIRVARAGCLDLCAQGPNIFVYPDGLWYSQVKISDLPEIIKKIADV